MNNGLNHNPAFNLPVGITEDDLVDLVDGALPKEREGAVIEALRREPRLGLLVKQMRNDRAEIAELATVRIPQPASMVDAIESKLNREALSELVAESEEIPASIPISSIQPMRRGLVSMVAESMWGRRLATAASLAIVAGLGYFAFKQLSNAWPSLPRPSPVADNTPPTGDSSNPDKIDTPSNDTELATRPTTAESTPAETLKPDTTATPIETAAAPKELTLPEALKLAESGRLIIAVRSKNYEGTLRHLQELSRASGSGHDARWRAFEPNALPQELAMLASPLPDDTAPTDRPPLPGQPNQAPVTIASTGPQVAPAISPETAQPETTIGPGAHVRVRTVRIVQTSADTRSLDDLLKDIAINKSHVARFRILPESAAAQPKPALDPESILWWSRGESAWLKRISVPVIVETAE